MLSHRSTSVLSRLMLPRDAVHPLPSSSGGVMSPPLKHPPPLSPRRPSSLLSCLTLSPSSRVVLLMALCTCVAYLQRVNISVAILDIGNERGWDTQTRGEVRASFFYGYITSQLAGALLARAFGGRRTLGIATSIWSLLTLLTPWCARHSLSLLLLLRFVLGVSEGVCFPVLYALLAVWVAPGSRTRATAVVSSGTNCGAVGAFLLTPLLSAMYGWPFVFYLFGAVGLVWVFVWFLIVPEQPPPSVLAITTPHAGSVHGINGSGLPSSRNNAAAAAIYGVPLPRDDDAEQLTDEDASDCEAGHLLPSSKSEAIGMQGDAASFSSSFSSSPSPSPVPVNVRVQHVHSVEGSINAAPSSSVSPPSPFASDSEALTLRSLTAMVTHILSSPPLLVICLASFTYSFAHYQVLTWLPTYFAATFGSHPDSGATPAGSGESQAQLLTFLPYVCMFGANNLGGWFVDALLIPHSGLSLRRVRQLSVVVGNGCLCLGLLAFERLSAPGEAQSAVVAMCFALAMSTLTLGAIDANTLEVVSPRHAGVFMAVSNTIATLGGVVGVPLSTLLLAHGPGGELGSWGAFGGWSAVWTMIAVVQIASAAIFCAFATTKIVMH